LTKRGDLMKRIRSTWTLIYLKSACDADNILWLCFASNLQGLNGVDGAQGPPGVDGGDGIDGRPGPSGRPGQDGNPVSWPYFVL